MGNYVARSVSYHVVTGNLLTWLSLVNIGISGHSLATDEPQRTDLLPSDEDAFDVGNMVTSEPLYVASPTNLRAGPFARTCQATNLLGKVVNVMIESVKSQSVKVSEYPLETVIQIHRTLTAFHQVLLDEFNRSPAEYASALALTYSALVHLCDPFSCADRTGVGNTVKETEVQAMSIETVRSVASSIHEFAQKLRPLAIANPAAMSPLIADCLYMGTATFQWKAYEVGSAEMISGYRDLRDALSLLSSRWAVAAEYNKAIDKCKEAIYGNSSLV